MSYLSSTKGTVTLSAPTGGVVVTGGLRIRSGGGVRLMHSVTLGAGYTAMVLGDVDGDGIGAVTVNSGTSDAFKVVYGKLRLNSVMICWNSVMTGWNSVMVWWNSVMTSVSDGQVRV